MQDRSEVLAAGTAEVWHAGQPCLKPRWRRFGLSVQFVPEVTQSLELAFVLLELFGGQWLPLAWLPRSAASFPGVEVIVPMAEAMPMLCFLDLMSGAEPSQFTLAGHSVTVAVHDHS